MHSLFSARVRILFFSVGTMRLDHPMRKGAESSEGMVYNSLYSFFSYTQYSSSLLLFSSSHRRDLLPSRSSLFSPFLLLVVPHKTPSPTSWSWLRITQCQLWEGGRNCLPLFSCRETRDRAGEREEKKEVFDHRISRLRHLIPIRNQFTLWVRAHTTRATQVSLKRHTPHILKPLFDHRLPRDNVRLPIASTKFRA